MDENQNEFQLRINRVINLSDGLYAFTTSFPDWEAQPVFWELEDGSIIFSYSNGFGHKQWKMTCDEFEIFRNMEIDDMLAYFRRCLLLIKRDKLREDEALHSYRRL